MISTLTLLALILMIFGTYFIFLGVAWRLWNLGPAGILVDIILLALAIAPLVYLLLKTRSFGINEFRREVNVSDVNCFAFIFACCATKALYHFLPLIQVTSWTILHLLGGWGFLLNPIVPLLVLWVIYCGIKAQVLSILEIDYASRPQKTATA